MHLEQARLYPFGEQPGFYREKRLRRPARPQNPSNLYLPGKAKDCQNYGQPSEPAAIGVQKGVQKRRGLGGTEAAFRLPRAFGG
jgi:hypothetical protein